MTCNSFRHYLLMTFSQPSPDLLMTFSWFSHEFLMTFSWQPHDFWWFLMTFSWLVHDPLTDLLTVKQTDWLTEWLTETDLKVYNCLDSLQLSWHSAPDLKLLNWLNRPCLVPFSPLFALILVSFLFSDFKTIVAVFQLPRLITSNF